MEGQGSFFRFLFNEDLYIIRDESPEREAPSPSTTTEPPSPQVIELTGTCVVVPEAQKDHPTLLNILKAAQLKEVDFVENLDPASGHANYVVFGQEPAADKYEIITTDGQRILYSDALEMLDADKTLKRKLWDQLQKMFLQ